MPAEIEKARRQRIFLPGRGWIVKKMALPAYESSIPAAPIAGIEMCVNFCYGKKTI